MSLTFEDVTGMGVKSLEPVRERRPTQTAVWFASSSEIGV